MNAITQPETSINSNHLTLTDVWQLVVAVVCDPVAEACNDNTLAFNEHNWIISLPVAVLNVN